MSDSQRKKVAIISDGLTGWLLAHVLKRKGHDVILVDTDNQPHADDRFRNMGLPLLPNTPLVRHGLNLLEECFDLALSIEVIESSPSTIEGGDLKPFVGFGDSKSSAVQPLSLYNQSSWLKINKPETDLIQLAQPHDTFKWLPYSEVTALHFDGSEVKKITINGQTDVEADQFVFLNAPKELVGMVPPELIGMKTRGRVAKSTAWARISLQFEHAAALTTQPELLFLLPLQPDHPPCVGRAFLESSVTGVSYRSLWETYAPAELAEDPEYVTDNLRSIRKLVRRAFPNLEASPKEAVNVDPMAVADVSWTLQNKDFVDLAENFAYAPRLGGDSLGFAQSVEGLSRAYDQMTSHKDGATKTSIRKDDSQSSFNGEPALLS